ncbi:enoyl-CoA hydratase-related protein [Sphingosinicella humi]|uniref:Enoyl-CoA hydratase n=1 Tax=Allosphingosinicella humi TaxID=2068657 RepID=A0A2U2IZB4_9SPHN|nr:enoyl-CoA hydratase-related protein [Sphingosinicella humi]PWG01371.1 enoyl-CoA hydratase [Sphingosinicella humi]
MEILAATNGPVMDIRLNRSEKKNAITVAMYAALADAIEQAAADEAIRAITISGSGGVFTAGNDIADFMSVRPGGEDMPVFRFLHAIAGCPKVVIAGAQGFAVGIGTTMLLHCDLVLAAPATTFSLPFVDLGLVPEAASSLLLPRLIGRQRAAKHLLLCDPFDAETALDFGLVTEIVPAEALDDRLRATAERIAAKPPEAVRLTKQLMIAPEAAVSERIAAEGALFEDRLASTEAAQAFAAFFARSQSRN